MELTIDQALQQGIAAHRDGRLQDAERFYRSILQAQPTHPHANHNLGLLAVAVEKTDVALPLFKAALEANPKMEQFWLSYIEALIKGSQFDIAKQVLSDGEKAGLARDKVDALASQLGAATKLEVSNGVIPPQQDLDQLMAHYQGGRFVEAEGLARSITKRYPGFALGWKVLGAVLLQTGRVSEALGVNQHLIQLAPQDAKAHSNLGVTLKQLGFFKEAEASYRQAFALKPSLIEVHRNLGNVFESLAQLTDAEASYRRALVLNPRYVDALWSLHSLEASITTAERFINRCRIVDTNYENAKLTKAAFRFYQGDSSYYDTLMQSDLKTHFYMRSLSWVFNLPTLPELFFCRWYFFDAIIKKSIVSRPFYEFGVWRGAAFKYLIKSFKKGYGFDTFTGLPEDWDVGIGVEKAGKYTSDGNVPNIAGGEFIVGKFEDTLPEFFSEDRPMASLLNFDADLYSSTICALNNAHSVMDKDTILVFDELIIYDSWEQGEFKALNEFCFNNNYKYEVIAVSFFTRQVAVKLIGI